MVILLGKRALQIDFRGFRFSMRGRHILVFRYIVRLPVILMRFKLSGRFILKVVLTKNKTMLWYRCKCSKRCYIAIYYLYDAPVCYPKYVKMVKNQLIILREYAKLVDAPQLPACKEILQAHSCCYGLRAEKGGCFLQHGDFVPSNIMLDRQKNYVFIDYDDVGYYPKYYDIVSLFVALSCGEPVECNPGLVLSNKEYLYASLEMMSEIDDKRAYLLYLLDLRIKHFRKTRLDIAQLWQRYRDEVVKVMYEQ